MRRIRIPLAVLACALVLATSYAADETAGWFGMSVNVDADGFFLSPTVHSATIVAVAADSPAAAGGLRAGDEIIDIEGLAVAGGKAKQLQAALAKRVGESLRVRLRRPGGETYTALLTAVRKPAEAGRS